MLWFTCATLGISPCQPCSSRLPPMMQRKDRNWYLVPSPSEGAFVLVFFNIHLLLLCPLLLFTFFNFINLFIYLCFWLCWVFVAGRGLSLVAASGGYSLLRCVCFSLQRLLLLQSMGFRHADSVVVAHGLCCSAACGIFLDQGSDPCPLHWQADS